MNYAVRKEMAGLFAVVASGLHGAFFRRCSVPGRRTTGTLRVCSFLAGVNGIPFGVTSVNAAGFYSTTALFSGEVSLAASGWTTREISGIEVVLFSVVWFGLQGTLPRSAA